MYIYRGKLNWFNYAVNEGITVIVTRTFELGEPASVAHQWTENGQGQQKVNEFSAGTIDSVVTTERKFGFLYDKYYRFNATFPTDMLSLSLVMRNPQGETSDPMNLHLVYDHTVHDTSVPRVYIGKMNWLDYAENEMFVVIAPETMKRERPLCAFWQWTTDGAGNEKVNVDDVDKLSTADRTEVGEEVTFMQGDFYHFTGLVDEDRNVMDVTMKNPQGEESDNMPLTIQSLSASRRRRAIVNHTSTILNDSDEAAFCTLRSSGTSTTDKVLGGISLALGFLGLPNISKFLQHNWREDASDIVAYISAVVGGAGAIQAFNDSEDAHDRLLFPGDSLTRQSSGGLGSSNNDAEITRVYINGQGALVIGVYKQETVGDTTLSLTQLFRDHPTPPRTLMALQLTPGRKRINDQGSPAIYVPHAMYTSNNSGELTYYGQIGDPAPQREIFQYDSSFTFVLGMPTSRNNHYEILQLPNGMPVLKLLHSLVRSWDEDDRRPYARTLSEGSVTGDSDVLSLISRQPGSWAYQRIGNMLVTLEAAGGAPAWKVIREENKHLYIVASKGPMVTQHLEEVVDD